MKISALPLALVVVLSIALAACSGDKREKPSDIELPFNAELTEAFRKVVQARDDRLRPFNVRSLELFCEKKPGPVKVTVTSTKEERDTAATFTSSTPCSETGTLVLVEERTRGMSSLHDGFVVRSRQPYDASLVVGEWQKALDAQLGTFTANELAGKTITTTHGGPLKDLRVELVEFACSDASKMVTYEARYQGGWRKGSTTVACPTVADKSRVLAQVVAELAPSADPRTITYSAYTVKSVDSMLAVKLVQDFLQAGGRRASF